MEVHVVIGANYGDEGKGRVVAEIAKTSKPKVLNVLTNGGAQRGHSFIYQDATITNKHFGSATVLGSIDNLFLSSFIMDPMQFHKEFNVRYTTNEMRKNPPKIYRSRYCRWTTPFDILANQIEALESSEQHTCGMGIWNTVQRFCNPGLALKFDEFMLLDYDAQVQYLKSIAEYYYTNRKTASLSPIPKEYEPFFNDPALQQQLIAHFILDCLFLKNNTEILEGTIIWDNYETVIFENGQGLAIGDDGVNDKFKTPSYTGIKAVTNTLADLADKISKIEVHYVSRTYETRHGDGTFLGEIKRKKISSYINEDATNPYNMWQGKFKYAPLNSMLLAQRIMRDWQDMPLELMRKSTTILELTHCDEVGPEDVVCNIVDKINYIDSPRID